MTPKSTHYEPGRSPANDKTTAWPSWLGRRGGGWHARCLAALLAVTALAGCATSGATRQADDAPPGFALVDATSSDLLSEVSDGDSKATLINVWASWCFPCVEELQELLTLREELHPKGFSLMLVTADSHDNAERVEAFLRENGVDYRTYIKAEEDGAFVQGLYPDWTGSMPLSLLYDGEGQLVKAWQSQVRGDEVRAEVLALLDED